jgi:Zn-dependent protease/predicted transcriptional regulator
MFSRSLTIFSVRGIPIRLHWSLAVLLPFLVYAGAYQFLAVARWAGIPREDLGLPPALWGLLLALGLLVSIVLHELAHALVGRRSGAKIRSITLMMLGGVTRMETETRPEREAWMALVGPLTSIALALVAYAVYRFAPLPDGVLAALLVFAGMNLVLGGFNLLPAFPMDGGRVLRGLLARRLGRRRATHIAARIGRGMALFLGIWGVLGFNLMLILIAVFVYSGATAEEQHTEVHDRLHGIAVDRIMTSQLGEAHAGERIVDVARRLLGEHLVAARVGANGGGVVTIWDLAQAAAGGGEDADVSRVVRHDLPVVHPDDDASEVLDRIAGRDATMAVVVDAGGETVGIVTPADVERATLLASLGPAAPPA